MEDFFLFLIKYVWTILFLIIHVWTIFFLISHYIYLFYIVTHVWGQQMCLFINSISEMQFRRSNQSARRCTKVSVKWSESVGEVEFRRRDSQPSNGSLTTTDSCKSIKETHPKKINFTFKRERGAVTTNASNRKITRQGTSLAHVVLARNTFSETE